jgi:catechol 2,3-dioxygenase
MTDELQHLFDSVIGTVTLRVSDLGLQSDFYKVGIGLEATAADGPVAELRGAPNHALIRLDSSRTAGTSPVSGPHTGLFHTAFRYSDRASLGAAVARTAELAREYQGASDHGVSEAVYFADPEGNGIELYWDRPYDEWPTAAEGRVGMYTQPLDLPALVRLAAPTGEEKAPDIGHIHLMTADVERTLGFWRDVVGLDERQRFGPSAVFLAEGLYHHHLGANSWHSAGADPVPEDVPGLDSFELRLRDPEAVERAAEALERLGVDVERSNGSVSFRDPDSNRVALSVR